MKNNIHIDSKQKYVVNGVEYNSFEELPEDFKRMLDQDGDGNLDMMQKSSKFTPTRIENGSNLNTYIAFVLIGVVIGYYLAKSNII